MPETTWLETSLTVDGELAEAVADVLGRFAPGGVAIESTAVTANLDDSQGHAVGPLRVVAYLRMDEQIEETRRRLEEALWYLGRIRPLPAAQFRVVKDTDWSEAWKKHYHPIPVGRRLIIVPAWEESPEKERIPIRIDPGMAFGTGTHPTTQLCLELIEEDISRLAGRPGASRSGARHFEPNLFGRALHPERLPREIHVIDLGCGSGILAIAALKLGASRALGVDIDADAVAATQENAARNGVAERLEAGQGSLSEVLAGKFSLKKSSLLLANILAPVLVRLLDEGLGELSLPGGFLVLSGIIAEQAEEVTAAAGRNGLRLVDRRQEGDWVALNFRKSA